MAFRSAFALLVLAVLTLVGCTRSASAPAPLHVRLGTFAWPGNYWIYVALKKGWFLQAGLDVERIDADNNYLQSVQALATGKIDGMALQQFDLVRNASAGHDLVGVVATDYSVGAEALISRAGITKLQGLRGGRIALPRSTYLHYLLAFEAERAGFDLDQVTLVDSGKDEALADFKAGKLDAIFTWEPYATEAREAVNGERVFSTEDFPGLTYLVFSLTRTFVNEHPAQVQALLQVWQRSVQFIRANPEESLQIVAAATGRPVRILRAFMRVDLILDVADNGRAFSYAGGFQSLHGAWRRMNDFVVRRDSSARHLDSPPYLDSRYVRALD